MPFSIDSIDISSVFMDGGRRIAISGSFELGNPYKVFIGDYKNDLDAVCYSGICEQGNIIYPELNNILIAYTPLLIPTGAINPYSITVINNNTLESHVLLDCILVYNKQFYTKVYEIRKLLLPGYLTGPINIENEDMIE